MLRSDEQQQLLQAQLDRSSHSTQALQLQVQRLQQDVATATAAASMAEDALHALQSQCSKQQDQIAQLQHGTANQMQQKSAAMLQLLEQQLVSLSGQIKQRDQQLAALRQTVQQQCDERILMQVQLVQMRRAASSAEGESANVASVSKEQQPLTAMPGASTSVQGLHDNNTTGTSHKGESGDTLVQSRSNQARLNRIASASEQSAGKTGLLARILSTDSTTGKACR